MLVTALAGDGQGQPDAYDAREHYTKYECRIPMRDGVRLFTAVLVPKDASTTYPFMVIRSPFGVSPYGVDEYSSPILHTDLFLKAGYIWVRQDVRGRGLSEGEFIHVTPHRPDKRTASDIDESTDAYDTIEWPGAVRWLHHAHRARGVHGVGPALRRDAAGRARLRDRAAGRGPDIGRPDLTQAVRVNDQDRLRLGREGDRRLSA
jgi:hypothetical protein